MNAALKGNSLFTQAAVFAGPGSFQLSNAYDRIIGG